MVWLGINLQQMSSSPLCVRIYWEAASDATYPKANLEPPVKNRFRDGMLSSLGITICS